MREVPQPFLLNMQLHFKLESPFAIRSYVRKQADLMIAN
jgi:hypothetical protein